MERTYSTSFTTIKSAYYSALKGTCLSNYVKGEKVPLLNYFFLHGFIYFLLPIYFMFHSLTGFYLGSNHIRFDAFAIALSELEIFVKSVCIHKWASHFRGVILNFDELLCVKHSGEKAINELLKDAKDVVSLQKKFQISGIMTFVTFTLSPMVTGPSVLFSSGTNYDHITKVLPIAYPFHINYIPVYQIFTAIESMVTAFALIHFVGADLFFVSIMKLLCSALKVLKQSIEDMDDPIAIRLFVQDHQKLLRICQEIKELLSPILALQLLVSALCICFAVIEIKIGNDASTGSFDEILVLIRKCSYTITVFFELVLFCWLSSDLEEATTAVRDGIYNGPWYLIKEKNVRDIIITSCRALRPIRLTALHMVNLHLGTSIEVLRAAYSYYTLLTKSTELSGTNS